MVSYEGIFFDGGMAEILHSLEIQKLDKINDEMHCTFKYHPGKNEIFNEIVGDYFEVYVIGYGNDGKNSGFKIQLPSELKEYYINYDKNTSKLIIPHITSSLAEEAKAMNTKNLDFKPLEKPVKLMGRFGYWIKEGNREYISYEPYIY